MWIHFDESELALVKDALRYAIQNNRAGAMTLLDHIEEKVSIFDADDPYRAAAQEKATDELEIDDDAIVSEGGDPGAWVHAWIWITDGEAGVDRDEETCDECNAPLDEAGDGYDGKCADCADKAEANA